MSKRAVITGSSGFIGRRLGKRLREEGWDVFEVGGRASGVDIADRANVLALRPSIAAGAVIFHIAGRAHEHGESLTSEDEYRRVNVVGTAHVLELASLVSAARFVHVSTVAVHGDVQSIVDENAPLVPATPYAASKLEAERLVQASTAPWTILRFPMVYGGLDRGNMTRIVRAIYRRRFPPLPVLHNARSVLHVDNAADALQLAATHPEAVGETFIITDAVPVSTTDIQSTTLHVLGRSGPRVRIPLWTLKAFAKVGDVAGLALRRRLPLDSVALTKLTESAVFSSSKVTSRLGFTPRFALQDGIRSMVNELRAQ